MPLFRSILALAALLMPCTGCCWVGCNVHDLAFVSLTPASSRATAGHPSPVGGHSTLKLEFSTAQDLVHFAQSTQATAGTYVRLTRCSGSLDPKTFIDLSPVYYGPDARSVDPGPGVLPVLRPGEDSRFTYEGFIRLDRELIPVRTLGLSYVAHELSHDPREYPDICFELEGTGFISHFGSNKARIPREAVTKVLAADRLPPGS